MKPRKIYLVRHGEIVTDGNRRYIGQLDLPLSDTGRKQAARLRNELACAELQGIFCSDLERSVSTARIICEKQSLEPVAKRELREISLGSWEGLTFDEVRRKYPGEFEKRGEDIFNYQPPGGESFAQCAGRVLSALEEILISLAGNVLIVGHAGVNRIILSRALGMSRENLFKIAQDYGCLNVLMPGDFGLKVITLNQVLRI